MTEPTEPARSGRTGVFFRPPDDWDELSDEEKHEAMLPMADALLALKRRHDAEQ